MTRTSMAHMRSLGELRRTPKVRVHSDLRLEGGCDENRPELAGGAELELHVLYLDFDGVLHPDQVYSSARRGIHLRDAPGHALFENAHLLVDEIRPYVGLKIVLSTSWVRVLGYDGARGRLPRELRDRCIGATYHSRHHRPGREDGARALMPVPLRGDEVLADVRRRRPTRWLAVDDADEGWPQVERSNVVISHAFEGIGSRGVLETLRAALRRFH